MRITVKCYATLDRFQPESGAVELPEGTTLLALMQHLGVDPEEAPVSFINDTFAPAATVLHDGDAVGLLPVVGGG